MNKETLRVATVKTVNMVVPILQPWIEANIARGRQPNQIFFDVQQLLAGVSLPPLPRAEPMLSDEGLIEELRERLANASRSHGLPRPLESSTDLTDKAP